MRPLYEENVHTRQVGQGRRTLTLFERGPHKWITPTILNGYAVAGLPYGDPVYRHGLHWVLEFDGMIDVSGAVSGDVAFILDDDYWPTTTFDLITSVRNSISFSAALLTADKDTGEVTFTWPIT